MHTFKFLQPCIAFLEKIQLATCDIACKCQSGTHWQSLYVNSPAYGIMHEQHFFKANSRSCIKTGNVSIICRYKLALRPGFLSESQECGEGQDDVMFSCKLHLHCSLLTPQRSQAPNSSQASAHLHIGVSSQPA